MATIARLTHEIADELPDSVLAACGLVAEMVDVLWLETVEPLRMEVLLRLVIIELLRLETVELLTLEVEGPAYSSTRLLPLSATQRSPEESNATPTG